MTVDIAADEYPVPSAGWGQKAVMLGLTLIPFAGFLVAVALLWNTAVGWTNLFLLVGPNTGTGQNSIIFMIESQLPYVIGALRELDRPGVTALEPRAEVQLAYNAEIQRELGSTVWEAGGCKSWYMDSRGLNTTLWPTFTWRWAKRQKPSKSWKRPGCLARINP